MDDQTILINAAIAYMQEFRIIEKFETIAVQHSHNSWKTSSPYVPLVLHLEIDLILLYDFSSDLYDKLVEYPAVGRLIFQAALAKSLNEYLRIEQCVPLTCIQLLLHSTFLSTLVDANSLFAKSHGCLSYMRRCFLTSLTIPRSNACNIVNICILSRCPNESCNGYAGTYVSMTELAGNEPLGNCSYCGKKCIEDPAGRGQVGRVFAKFMPVIGVCNNREETTEHTAAVICSITEPLLKELELGDMYDLWGRYNDLSIFEVWGLQRTSFFSSQLEIPLSPLPPNIRSLLTSIGEPETNPWIFVRRLALELGSNVYQKNAAVSLKMGLLLSLATLGSERCAPILCVGPNIGIVEEDIISWAAKCADRNVYITFPISINTTKNGENTWLHSGSLLKAKTGVCNVGNWESLKTAQKNDLLSVLDDRYITNERKDDNNVSENDNVESIQSSLPLRTAVWTYHKFPKDLDQQQSIAVTKLTKVFGIPVYVDKDTTLTVESIHKRFEIFLHGSKVNQRTISIDELTKFLRFVNGIAVTLSDEAVKLMKDYFVVSRKVRGDIFPARSNTFMTTLAEAHARLSLRNRVTDDDVIAVIFLYEEAMHFLYGQSVATPPSFVEHDTETIGDKMETFKLWLTKYLKSVFI